MYFGDWLRTSEIKHVWYVSFKSEDDNFPQRIHEALKKNGQVQKISPTCLMIESTEAKGVVVKRLRKTVNESDDAVLIYPHNKIIGHQKLTPWGSED